MRRVAAVLPVAPRREGAPHRQAGFYLDDSAPDNSVPDNNAPDNNAPDNNARTRTRDNREVRQLTIRPGAQGGAHPRSGRAITVGPGVAGPGLQAFGGAPFASIQFLAQVIGQAEEWSSGPLAYHPDGIALGSEAYRRAGAAPPHYSEQPTVFRVAI